MFGQHGLALVRQAVTHGILSRGREEAPVHTFGLHPQHQHRVGQRQFGVDVVGHRDRPAADADGEQRGWGDQHHFRAKRVQQRHVGAGHAAVQDVTDDHHPLALDTAEPLPDGQRVQQGLGGVFMGAVTGVDHTRAAVLVARPLGQLLSRTRCGVTHDQRIGAGRAQRQRGVAQRLPFGDRGSRSADVDDVGTHPLAGDLERHPGPGGVLVEHRDDGPPPQGGQLLDLAADQRFAEPVGVVQDRGGVVAAEVGRGQQVFHLGGPPYGAMWTPS